MDFATTDLILAILHHMLVFSLAGVLAFEIGAIRPGMNDRDITRVARVDIWYGILAAAILAVGFARVHFAAKGWAYYSVNMFFWAKMASFALVGILSILPTVKIIHWRRALKEAPLPAAAEIVLVRRFLWTEALVFAFILIFAAAMARGYG